MKTGTRLIPDVLLERYLADALPAEARSEVEALLARSPEEREWLEALRADSAAFLLKHPPGPLVARFQEEERQRQLQRELPKAVFPQAARASRLRRALTVGSIVFLALLVAASAVALVAMEQQARMAREAEAKFRRAKEDADRQLAEVEAKHQKLLDALRVEEKARKELTSAYAHLRDTNAQVLKALHEAREAQKRARIAHQNAAHNATVALRAEQEALQAAERLSRKQELDRARIEFLEQQIGSVITNLE